MSTDAAVQAPAPDVSVTPSSESARMLARTAGLRDLRLPRLADVDRRRAQLWVLSLFVALVVPAIVVVVGTGVLDATALGGETVGAVIGRRNVQLGLAAMLVVVMGYVAEREVSLRRLTRLLLEEEALTASLVGRVRELNLLMQATRAMNSALDLDTVLTQIAGSALSLLGARGVTIMLVDHEGPDRLVVAATAGRTDATVGAVHGLVEGIVGGAVTRRDALLVAAETAGGDGQRGTGGTIIVPMEVRGNLVGVIAVDASQERRPFSEFDLRSMDVFGDAAAGAIANARSYTAQLNHIGRLLEQGRVRDEFLTLVTHELRTPLTSVIGLMTTMAKRGLTMAPEQMVECAEMAGSQGWRLDQLIENLLDSSRVITGGLVLSPQVVDVGAEITDMAAGLQRALPTHTITVSAPEGLYRRVDVDAVRRILDNLLSNSAKFCPPGSGVHITLRATLTGIVVSVADSGSGLDGTEMQTLFDRFSRGEDPFDRGGLGLGLFVVQALAEAHGGRVEVDGVPGCGTTITVVLSAPPVVATAAH